MVVATNDGSGRTPRLRNYLEQFDGVAPFHDVALNNEGHHDKDEVERYLAQKK